jgi:hypothetical protein
MQATDTPLTVEEPAAAFGVTVRYLRHDADCLSVEMLATGEGFILPWSDEPPTVSTPIGIGTASPSDPAASRTLWR